MIEKMKTNGFKIIMYIFVLMMSYILLYSLFKPYGYEKSKLSGLVILMGMIFLLLGVLVFGKYIDNSNDKKLNFIIGICFFVSLAIQFIIGLNIKAVQNYDLFHIHKEAISMLEDGIITNEWYFGRYPNNIPITILLYWVFKVFSFIGINNYRVIGILFNIGMISISNLLSYLIMLKLKDKKTAVKFLGLCTINPVLYTYAPYYYTDTLSLPFLMGAIYLYLIVEKEQKKNRKVILTLLLGCILLIGFKLRATIGIFAIAIIVYRFIKEKNTSWKKFTLVFVIGLLITSMFYKSIENKYVKFDYNDSSAPVTHWIMMGLQGDGGYFENDLLFTQSFDTKKDKIKANLKEIANRLYESGPSGYIELVGKKIQRTWSRGTHNYEVYLGKAEYYSKVYDYIVGNKNIVFTYYCQIFNASLLFLIVLGAINYIRRKRIDFFAVLYIELFGGILFYILWESNPRYSVGFILVMIMLMLQGMRTLEEIKNISDNSIILSIEMQGNRYEYSEQIIQKFTKRIGIMLMALSIGMSIVNFSKYTMKLSDKIDYSVNQIWDNGDNIKELLNDDSIIQTFNTDKPFNNIEISFQTNNRENTCAYIVELQNEYGSTIYKECINAEDVQKDKYYKISFDTVVPEKMMEYRIKIYSNDAVEGNALGLTVFSVENYDIFTSGKLYINDKESLGDLKFIVYNSQKKPYSSIFEYCLVSMLIILAEIYILRKISNCKKDELKDALKLK